jgi:hypothetical protein
MAEKELIISKLKFSVEIEKETLVLYRDHVRVKFEAIDHKTEKLSYDMIVWLNETEKLIQEVVNLLERAKTLHVPRKEFRKLREKVMAQNRNFINK